MNGSKPLMARHTSVGVSPAGRSTRRLPTPALSRRRGRPVPALERSRTHRMCDTLDCESPSLRGRAAVRRYIQEHEKEDQRVDQLALTPL